MALGNASNPPNLRSNSCNSCLNSCYSSLEGPAQVESQRDLYTRVIRVYVTVGEMTNVDLGIHLSLFSDIGTHAHKITEGKTSSCGQAVDCFTGKKSWAGNGIV